MLCCLLLPLLSCVTCACCILCLWIFGHANLHNHSSAFLLLFFLLNPNNHRATLSALLCLEKLCVEKYSYSFPSMASKSLESKTFDRQLESPVLKGINEWGSVGPALLLSTRVSRASCLISCSTHKTQLGKISSRDHHQHHRVKNHFYY